MCVLGWGLVGVVWRVRAVPVEHEVRDVLSELTGAGCDRVREQDGDTWDEPMHAPKVAFLTKTRQPPLRVSY